MSIELVPLGTATIGLAPPMIIPNTPLGTRLIVEVSSFRLVGDRVRASQKGVAAADWALVTPDGKLGTLDVRVTLETDDGALIFMHYSGRLDLSEGFGARPAYTAPLFETGDERYTWLNAVQAVAKGTLSADLATLTYEIYEVR